MVVGKRFIISNFDLLGCLNSEVLCPLVILSGTGFPKTSIAQFWGFAYAKFCEGALASRVKPALAQGSIMEFVLLF